MTTCSIQALNVVGVEKRLNPLFSLGPLSLALDKGCALGVLGQNGSGKTTLLNILSGLLVPDKGRVFVGPSEITGLNPSQLLAQGVARLFQRSRLVEELTVIENVSLGRYWQGPWGWSRGPSEVACLRWAGIEHEANRYVDELTYFDQRKVELCRLVVSSPRLMLLDEPTSGLSPHERTEFARLVADLKTRDITLIIVEHDLVLVRAVCDTFAVLNRGEAVFCGSRAEFFGRGVSVWNSLELA